MEKKFKITSNIPEDLEPNESTILWRYMSFSSLCEILMNDYIPLIPIQNFSDKSEGRILKEILSKLPYANKLKIEETIQLYKETTYASSWYNAQNENASMWDRYTYKGDGVAVKTNAKLLLDSIMDTPIDTSHIIIKRMKYIDYQPTEFGATIEELEQGNDKLCFFYKMDDYKDESEIRILTSRFAEVYRLAYAGVTPLIKELLEKLSRPVYQQLADQGYNISEQISPYQSSIPLDITSSVNLIEQIIVSPHSHDQFIKTVQQTIENINIYRRSQDRPIFQVSKVIESRRKNWI